MILHTTSIDIPEPTRKSVIDLLNEELADTFDLYSQVKQAHWNVKGPQFFQLHELFDDIAEQLLGHVDDIAERVTTLGGTAMGTAKMAAAASRLDPYPDNIAAGTDHLAELVRRFAVVAAAVRAAASEAEELDDISTSDLFVEVSRSIDKSLWFLEAHLQG